MAEDKKDQKIPPYTFSQTLNDISVNIPLDRKVKGSELLVKINKTSISVKCAFISSFT